MQWKDPTVELPKIKTKSKSMPDSVRCLALCTTESGSCSPVFLDMKFYPRIGWKPTAKQDIDFIVDKWVYFDDILFSKDLYGPNLSDEEIKSSFGLDSP